MALPMARPILINGTFYFKQRVPGDLVHVVGRTQVKISLRTKDPSEARRLHAEQAAATRVQWDLLRTGPATLDDKQVEAVAGLVYRAFLAAAPKGARNPLVHHGFAGVRWFLEMAIGDAPILPDDFDPSAALESILGAQVNAALDGRCVVDGVTRSRILRRAAVAVIQAGRQVARECEGDYRPDPDADRFPDDQVIVKNGGAHAMFEAVWAEAKGGYGLKTSIKYARIMEDLMTFVGTRDLSKVTQNQVKKWRDHLLRRPGLKPRTVQRDYLGSIKAVFASAVRTEKLEINPVERVHVESARRDTGRQMRSFTNEEAEAILAASLKPVGGRVSAKLAAAFRWVPWLCAYTGARVNEMTQIRRCDVRQRDGHWCVTITPEAGTQKSDKAHDVPLHEHLIAQGFLEFVATHDPEEPLFYNARKSRAPRKTFPSEHVGKRLALWVRDLGVTDTTVNPNHGWRHRFKTDGRYSGMKDNALDALQGHTIPGIGARYGEFPARVTAAEVAKFPRFDFVKEVN